jgi:RimJ/RimL family protein N-acetyltransferase
MGPIRTERLLLRFARAADLEPMHAILSDPGAMAYWSTPPHATLDETRAWLRAMIDTSPDEGEDFIVEHEGRVIGKAGLWRFPEVGYILAPAAWGQGFASEALRAVLGRAFDTHGLEAVTADVDPRNERSLRLLGRLGFRQTGRKARTWLVGDRWCDSVYLRLDCGRWPTHPTPPDADLR